MALLVDEDQGGARQGNGGDGVVLGRPARRLPHRHSSLDPVALMDQIFTWLHLVAGVVGAWSLLRLVALTRSAMADTSRVDRRWLDAMWRATKFFTLSVLCGTAWWIR